MAMTKLVEEVKELIEKEYGRAGATFGLTNHSDHESYAIILEEFQEAKDEAVAFERYLNQFWDYVRGDWSADDKFFSCNDMQMRAMLCACEMIQVAAMAKKAALTICDRAALVGVWTESGDRL